MLDCPEKQPNLSALPPRQSDKMAINRMRQLCVDPRECKSASGGEKHFRHCIHKRGFPAMQDRKTGWGGGIASITSAMKREACGNQKPDDN